MKLINMQMAFKTMELQEMVEGVSAGRREEVGDETGRTPRV